MRHRRRFSQEFKRAAVRLVNDGMPISSVAREMDIASSRLLAWKQASARLRCDYVPAAPHASATIASHANAPSISNNEDVHLLLEVHDVATGMIDPVAFAHALNISVATLAQILGCEAARLMRNVEPDDAVRELLNDMYRIIVELRNKLGSLEYARMWLHAPHPDLHKGTPLEYLRQHRIRPLLAAINAIHGL